MLGLQDSILPILLMELFLPALRSRSHSPCPSRLVDVMGPSTREGHVRQGLFHFLRLQAHSANLLDHLVVLLRPALESSLC
mgnify:CR=1 FL=1